MIQSTLPGASQFSKVFGYAIATSTSFAKVSAIQSALLDVKAGRVFLWNLDATDNILYTTVNDTNVGATLPPGAGVELLTQDIGNLYVKSSANTPSLGITVYQ